MIDPAKLKPSLVDAVVPFEKDVLPHIAAFLNALLADDEAMTRALMKLQGFDVHQGDQQREMVRAAIIAAVTDRVEE